MNHMLNELNNMVQQQIYHKCKDHQLVMKCLNVENKQKVNIIFIRIFLNDQCNNWMTCLSPQTSSTSISYNQEISELRYEIVLSV